ncbi:antibiotic biosynthesis monooxygenase family protein [Streptomyces sp. NPDC048277]|uniref:antibiotic biosynthesis monooxygenase family protein n=1 Tax=Streptomyces sp. NPDC048277 TaxID=3155027 RepID=UPI0033F7E39F
MIMPTADVRDRGPLSPSLRSAAVRDHRHQGKDTMPITLVNSFTVPPDKEQAFLHAWHSTIDHFATAPGFLQTRLCRNTGLNDTTFRYVNVALWEDVDAYRAAFRDFTPAGQRIPGVKAYPGLFEVIVEVNGASRHLDRARQTSPSDPALPQ